MLDINSNVINGADIFCLRSILLEYFEHKTFGTGARPFHTLSKIVNVAPPIIEIWHLGSFYLILPNSIFSIKKISPFCHK